MTAAQEKAKQLVRQLGNEIGYGAMMLFAEQLWREALVMSDMPPGGEHTVGPCAAFMVPCPHLADGPSNRGCDWCLGAGRINRHHAELIARFALSAPRQRMKSQTRSMTILGTWIDEDNSDPRVHIIVDDADWLRVVCTDVALIQLERDNIQTTRAATCEFCKRGVA